MPNCRQYNTGVVSTSTELTASTPTTLLNVSSREPQNEQEDSSVPAARLCCCERFRHLFTLAVLFEFLNDEPLQQKKRALHAPFTNMSWLVHTPLQAAFAAETAAAAAATGILVMELAPLAPFAYLRVLLHDGRHFATASPVSIRPLHCCEHKSLCVHSVPCCLLPSAVPALFPCCTYDMMDG